MEPAVRGAVYLGMLLLLGAGVFARWIGPDLLTPAVRRRLLVGLIGGAALLCLGSAIDLAAALTRAVGSVDRTLLGAYLADTRHGNAVLARLACVLLLVFLGAGHMPPQPSERTLHGLVGLGLLATFSLTSHAAGLSRATPVVADLVHLTAAAAWGGTLLYVAWLPIWPGSGQPAHALTSAVHRLSWVGFAGVAALVATGVYASLQQVWGPAALPASQYGRALLYKLSAVGVVFVMAAVNRWVLVPALADARTVRRLARLVKVECLALIGVFGFTGLLISQAPPERPASLAAVGTFQERAGPWTIHGSMTPRVPEGLDLAFGITDRTGGPPPAALEVSVALTMLDHPMAPVVTRLSPLVPGVYRTALPLPMAGRWQLTIRFPEGEVQVGLQARSVEAVPGWRLDLRSVGPGLLYLLFAAGLWLHAVERLGLHNRTGRRRALLSVALAVAGMVLLVRSQIPATSAPGTVRIRSNPVPATPESLARGEDIYRQHCQSCHGVGGTGDGPAATALAPRPADLRVHMAAGHTDQEFFNWLTAGMPGTAMPAFGNVLTEEDRWHVLNYIRTFAPTDR